MSKIEPSLDITPEKTQVWKRLRRAYELLAVAINGNVEFGNPTSGPVNIRGAWISTTTPAGANSDFTVTHNLGRPCVGYIVATADRAVDIYTSPSANAAPTTQIILRASVASAVVTLFLF
jgi:hypothetical protein